MKPCIVLIALLCLATFTSVPSLAEKSRFMALKSGAIALDRGRSHMPLRSAAGGKGLALPKARGGYISLAKYQPLARPALSLPTGIMAASKHFESKQTAEHTKATKASKRATPHQASSTKTHAHQWPMDTAVAQRVSSPFGYRKDPFTGERAFHAGIDIAAAEGTKVLASAEGVVRSVGTHPRLGRYIRIDHRQDEYSLYGHLSDIRVEEGQKVSAQTIIGAVGSTGRSTGPHLDYSLRRNSKPVDPLKVLPAAPAKQSASLR